MRQLSLLPCLPPLISCISCKSAFSQRAYTCNVLVWISYPLSSWQEPSPLLLRLVPLPFPACLICCLSRVRRQPVGSVVARDWRSCSGNTVASFPGLWGGA